MTTKSTAGSESASVGAQPSREAWITLIAIAAGYLVVQLAMTPVSLSLPSILAEFQGELVLASWVMSAYFLLLTAALLPAGRLGDRLGRERLFVWGMVGFAAASILCAVAPSLIWLVAARGLQGLAGALVASTAFGIAISIFPQSYRGRVIGLVTMASSMGLLLGVFLSSLVLSQASWRVIFVTMTVLTVAVIYPASRIRPTGAPEAPGRFDWVGVLLLAGSLAAAFLSLSHGHDGPETFEAGAAYHLTMNLVAVVLIAAFVWWERRRRDPLIDLRMFTRYDFSSASGANVIMHMSMMSMGFLLPFLIERGTGRTPIDTGLLLLVSQISTTSCTYAGGWLFDRTRSPLLRPLALFSIALGLGGYAWFGTSLGYSSFFGFAVLLGIGTGVFMTANNVAILNAVPESAKGLGNGMIETTRQLGHGLSVAIAGSIMAAAVFGNDSPAAYVLGFREAMGVMTVIALIGVGLTGYAFVRRWVGPQRRATVAGT